MHPFPSRRYKKPQYSKTFIIPPPPSHLCVRNAIGLSLLKSVYFRVLGAFAKLRKTTVASSRLSVCSSVRMELGSHWTNFHDI